MQGCFRTAANRALTPLFLADARSFDAEAMEIVEYAMQHPDIKTQIYRIKQLPLKKQKSLHLLFDYLIQEYERI